MAHRTLMHSFTLRGISDPESHDMIDLQLNTSKGELIQLSVFALEIILYNVQWIQVWCGAVPSTVVMLSPV